MNNNKNFFPYVLSELHGGLGNLLFQYAAGLSISRKLKSRLVFFNLQEGSIEWLESYLGKNLDIATSTELVLLGNSKRVKNKNFKTIIRIFNKLNLRLGPIYFGGMMIPLEKKIISKSRFALNLNGYYQHQSFYADVKNEILEMLAKQIYGLDFKKTKLQNRTLIHIRRGDYLHHPGWTINKEYYLNVLKKYDPERLDPVCIVSNEDLAVDAFENYCIKLGYKITKLPHLKDNKEIQNKNISGNFISNATRDFLAISQSKRVIMSNTTFAWWGVSLGDFIFGNSVKETIYPKGWLPNMPDTLKQDHWISENTNIN